MTKPRIDSSNEKKKLEMMKKESLWVILERMFQFFVYFGSRRFVLIPIRGFRSWTLFRCIYFFGFVISLLIILFFVYQIEHYFAYLKFLKEHRLSSVPFWKDNRSEKFDRLKPIRGINDVYLLNSTIAIGACCRNVKKYLQGFQRNIRSITTLFGQYRIYLYESDSSDQTLKYLKEWKQNDSEHIRVYSVGVQRLIYSRKLNKIILWD